MMKKTIIITLAVASLFTSNLFAKKTNPAGKHLTNAVRFDESNKIKFILDGKTFDLQAYNLTFYAPSVDKTSASTIYQTSSVNVTVRTSKIDQELLDWILSPDPKLKDGQIIVYDSETNKVLKKITLTGLKTNNYSENNNIGFNMNTQYTSLNFKYQTVSIKL